MVKVRRKMATPKVVRMAAADKADAHAAKHRRTVLGVHCKKLFDNEHQHPPTSNRTAFGFSAKVAMKSAVSCLQRAQHSAAEEAAK